MVCANLLRMGDWVGMEFERKYAALKERRQASEERVLAALTIWVRPDSSSSLCSRALVLARARVLSCSRALVRPRARALVLSCSCDPVLSCSRALVQLCSRAIVQIHIRFISDSLKARVSDSQHIPQTPIRP